MKHIRIVCLTLVLAILLGNSCNKADAKEINIAVASDIHLSKTESNGKRDLSNSYKALTGFVKRTKENDYNFVMFTGDVIDKSTPINAQYFFETIKGIDTPYYMVIGNHDAHKIAGMTKKEYLEIISANNPHQKKAKSSYYFYPTNDVIAIVIDGASSGMPCSHGIFNPDTLKWLDELLTKNKDKKAIIFQHFPLVEPSVAPSHDILNKNEYKAIINKHDNILIITSGHYHKEAYQKDENGIAHLSAPALYEAPYYYVHIKISYDKHPFSKAKNFKIWAEEKPAI